MLERSEFLSIYNKACDDIRPYIWLDEDSHKPLDASTTEGTAVLEGAIAALNKCYEEQLGNWPILWMIGKAQQALSRHEEAYNTFKKALEQNENQIDVLRETAIECLILGKPAEAVYHCGTAIEENPTEYTLWSNLSISLLLNNKLDQAEQWAKKTIAQLSNDPPALAVLRILPDLRSGKRQLPKDLPEFENVCRTSCDPRD